MMDVKRLPVCEFCRSEMQLWTRGVYACKRCDDFRSGNYDLFDVYNGIDTTDGQDDYLRDINSSDYAFDMNFMEDEFRRGL